LIWNLLRSRAIKQRPSTPDGYRIYAVGDVHGRADLLSELLARIDEDLANRPIADSIEIFLGDYIDRGPASRDVIELLINRRRRRDAIFLRGNHEDYALGFLSEPTVMSSWQNIGGLHTLASYGIPATPRDNPQAQQDAAIALRRAMPDSHLKFLQGLALSFTCGDFYFVHAGVRPGVALHMQSRQDLLGIRHEFLLHEGDFGKVIVHGHTPTAQPEVLANRINIDTGAYATDRLTCLVLEDDEMDFI
jgi:serine/threonine protein phosphatase 1